MKSLRIVILFIYLCVSFLSYSQGALYNIGKRYAEAGYYEDAIIATKQCLAYDSVDPNKYNLLLDYIALCEYFSYCSQSDSCLQYANKAIELNNNDKKIERSEILRILSHSLNRVGFHQQAIGYRQEIEKATEGKYGKNSPRLIEEYRILSIFSQEAGNKALAVKYAKMEEDLAYQIQNTVRDSEISVTYEESFGYMLYVIQENDDPVQGIEYILNQLNLHGEALKDDYKIYSYDSIWTIIEKNNLIDELLGITKKFGDPVKKEETLFSPKLIDEILCVDKELADNYIQKRMWTLYKSKEYAKAMYVGKKLVSIREKFYGEGTSKVFEWLSVMAYNAYESKSFDDLSYLCKYNVETAERIYGVNSNYFKEAVSLIRGYAHRYMDIYPKFTTAWIEPYYQKIQQLNILPKFQYEFEILLQYGFLSMGNLLLADKYAHKLERWIDTDNSNNVPLEDRVRILLKLANHYLQIGDHMKSRVRVEKAWKYLSEAKVQPSMEQLIDRHIVEQGLRMDTVGRNQINAEWIIETATPIINAGVEDSETLAFFYESRARAYDGINDLDHAISDMKQSIMLKPLSSRTKKLAQFYMGKRDFEQAEQLFEEIYNDPLTPVIAKQSVESDLSALYWLWGKLDKLGEFLALDYESVKSDIRNAFAFMNDAEREIYLEQSILGGSIKYDFYTSYSHDKDQWGEGNRYAYSMALMQKGLLLETAKDIDRLVQSLPDSLKSILKDFQFYKSFDIGDREIEEDEFTRESRLKLMNYVSKQPSFLQQLNAVWTDVRDNLKENEAAIEFINLWGINPDNMDSSDPCIGALILRKNMNYPIFVRLATTKSVDSLYAYDEDGILIPDDIYSGNKKEMLYNLVWSPLMPYLNGVVNLYYAPVGYLQNINIDWIGSTKDDYLADRFNLYRVSSTRELIKKRKSIAHAEALLMGDIEYSNKGNAANDTPCSKYRSISRSGFGPLKGTAEEVKSIADTLTCHNYANAIMTRLEASETAVRELSGNAPTILHFATHGFFYPKEKLDDEIMKCSFMGFQALRSELFHSGIALAGAQDTWHNDSISGGFNFNKYYSMDSTSDGVLLSSEISKLDLGNTDLVVLSACETALGTIKSDGVYGLQRAFKLAGVNSLIMSLWKVDDDATQLLMTSFYQYYLNGMSKREALLAAQKKVSNTAGFKDPYNWAGWILLDGLN